MESIAAPLRVLQEEAAWFARARELKLLAVDASRAIADAVEQVVMGQYYHADNRSLFFLFREALSAGGSDWNDRAAGLLAEWERQRETLAKESVVALAALAPLPAPANVARFANTVAAAETGLAAPLSGLVLVFAPVRVEDAAGAVSVLSALLLEPRLANTRFVVIDYDNIGLGNALAQLLGEARVARCRCLVDEAAQQRDVENLANAASSAPPPAEASPAGPKPGAPGVALPAGLPLAAGPKTGNGSAGAVNGATKDSAAEPAAASATPQAPAKRPTKLGGGAGPDVVPPPRVDAPREPSDEDLLAAGLSPAFIKGGGERLKGLVLAAAVALRKGQLEVAIRQQGLAAELCGHMQMPREQVVNLLTLGSYWLAGGAPGQARQVYASAAELAKAQQLPGEFAQAQLALGMLAGVERDATSAMAHYAAAGHAAEGAQLIPIAIECWRMAGQLAAEHQAEQTAIDSFGRAVALARALGPEEVKGTSAAESARLLATYFRERGLLAQADSLEQTSFRLEHGLPPEAPVQRA